jgi:uncharacterized SAM-binding protein YcdF (DUF218 family)
MTRRILCRSAAFAALLALIVFSTVAFRGAGRWLVREDALRPADVIVVLSGAMPQRAEEAARIFRLGYARQVWLTRPESPAQELSAMGVHYMGEQDYNRDVLIHEGVPDSGIRVLPDTIIDTEQEVDEITREMRRGGISSAIIVTSPPHTRRVRVLWRELAPRNLHAIVRAAHEDPFDADYWWRNTRDAFSVAREMLGLLNAWAGLPVRPRAR